MRERNSIRALPKKSVSSISIEAVSTESDKKSAAVEKSIVNDTEKSEKNAFDTADMHVGVAIRKGDDDDESISTGKRNSPDFSKT